jgi:hypothetical protein
LPLDEGRAFVNGWLWPHIATCWHAAPLMIERRSGLMIEIIEAILEGFGVTEMNWREAAANNPQAKNLGWIASETPCFVGRAVAALAAGGLHG